MAAADDEQQNPRNDGNITVEEHIGGGTSVTCEYSSSDAAIREEKASKSETEEKKYTKKEWLKNYNDRMERYMKFALQKYNNDEQFDKDMQFMFEETRHQNWIVEGEFDNKWYYHFNFTAKCTCSTTCLFFVEVVLNDGDDFDIICCKILQKDDNGHCFGCKNTCVDLKHPSCDSVYVGGHEDRRFPFMVDTDSEDDD